MLAHLSTKRPIAVCNIGIGVWAWDDWLGHVVGASITSVDRDAEVCRVFAYRQQREGHPHPARVVCGDVLNGALGDSRFDVITCVGSTIHEIGDRGNTRRALDRGLVPGGRLLMAECGEGSASDHVRTCGDIWLACSRRTG